VSRLEKLIQQFFQEPPEVRVEDARKILEFLGYEERRGGKHACIFRHPNGDMQTVPTVSGRKVKRTYVKKIVKLLKEAGYGPQD
jgi:predicted RNA binding protein YcfA (HicA-like mRNA interferase family)